jgi:hypothetical protein
MKEATGQYFGTFGMAPICALDIHPSRLHICAFRPTAIYLTQINQEFWPRSYS